jgi:hypothetical protein
MILSAHIFSIENLNVDKIFEDILQILEEGIYALI